MVMLKTPSDFILMKLIVITAWLHLTKLMTQLAQNLTVVTAIRFVHNLVIINIIPMIASTMTRIIKTKTTSRNLCTCAADILVPLYPFPWSIASAARVASAHYNFSFRSMTWLIYWFNLFLSIICCRNTSLSLGGTENIAQDGLTRDLQHIQ